MKKKILVTGGMGYVGGRLVTALIGDYTVLVSSRNPPTSSLLCKFSNVLFVSHESLLSIDSFPDGIDIVIHLAALNEIDSVKFPSDAIEVNINHTRKILDAATARKVKRFIYFSTVHVYGKRINGQIITEETLPRPTHPYAITHRAAEDYVNQAHDSGNIEGLIVRLSNSFGSPILPNVNRWSLLVNDICKQAVTTNAIRLYSNGCQFRDFITLSDVENAIKFLIDKDKSEKDNLFNLCSERSMTVLDMANLVSVTGSGLLGTAIPILLPLNNIPTEEKFYTIKSNNFLKHNIRPANNFKKELIELLEFCNENFNKHD